jgi:hypothetical protein
MQKLRYILQLFHETRLYFGPGSGLYQMQFHHSKYITNLKAKLGWKETLDTNRNFLSTLLTCNM